MASRNIFPLLLFIVVVQACGFATGTFTEVECDKEIKELLAREHSATVLPPAPPLMTYRTANPGTFRALASVRTSLDGAAAQASSGDWSTPNTEEILGFSGALFFSISERMQLGLKVDHDLGYSSRTLIGSEVDPVKLDDSPWGGGLGLRATFPLKGDLLQLGVAAELMVSVNRIGLRSTWDKEQTCTTDTYQKYEGTIIGEVNVLVDSDSVTRTWVEVNESQTKDVTLVPGLAAQLAWQPVESIALLGFLSAQGNTVYGADSPDGEVETMPPKVWNLVMGAGVGADLVLEHLVVSVVGFLPWDFNEETSLAPTLTVGMGFQL